MTTRNKTICGIDVGLVRDYIRNRKRGEFRTDISNDIVEKIDVILSCVLGDRSVMGDKTTPYSLDDVIKDYAYERHNVTVPQDSEEFFEQMSTVTALKMKKTGFECAQFDPDAQYMTYEDNSIMSIHEYELARYLAMRLGIFEFIDWFSKQNTLGIVKHG